MNNCEDWYEMTEQALSTINKLIPVDSSETTNETLLTRPQQQPSPQSLSPPSSQNIKTTITSSTNNVEGNENVESSANINSNSGSIHATTDVQNQQNPVANNGDQHETQKQQKVHPTPVETSSQQQVSEKDGTDRQQNATIGRGIILSMLISDGLIKPGVDVLSFEHMDQKFTADLLADGKTRWSITDKIFSSISAWIIHCKKVTFPNEKITCSVTDQIKYKGRSLDAYKTIWLKKHKPFVVSADDPQNVYDIETDLEGAEEEKPEKITPIEDNESGLNWILNCSSMGNFQESIPHSKLGRRSFQGIPNLFVGCSSFIKMNRVQPFRLNVTKNCLLLLHFHCHLIGSEVVGYLAGKWDSAAQQLIITQTYPCKCSLNAPKDETDRVEYEIMTNMDKANLVLVGWYHSHIGCQADPSLKDVETQIEYQFQLKGYESSTFQPCVGVIVSPFHMQGPAQLTSDMKIFYVYPPPEQRPLDYGMPLEVEHTISKDDYVTDRIITEMEKVIKFYSDNPDYLPKKFKKGNLPVYLNKLKDCLSPFCPSGYLSESIVKVFESF